MAASGSAPNGVPGQAGYPGVWQLIVDNVLLSARVDFLEEGVDISVLQPLKELWETKLRASVASAPRPAAASSQALVAAAAAAGASGKAAIRAPAPAPSAAAAAPQAAVPVGRPPQVMHLDIKPAVLPPAPPPATGQKRSRDEAEGGSRPTGQAAVTGPAPAASQLAATAPAASPAPASAAAAVRAPQVEPQASAAAAAPPLVSAAASVPAPAPQVESQGAAAAALHERDASGEPPAAPSDGALDEALWAEALEIAAPLCTYDGADDGAVAGGSGGGPGAQGGQPGGGGGSPLSGGSDSEEEMTTDNVIIAQYEKVTRQKKRWKCLFKNGMMRLNGKDYVFNSASGDFLW